MSEIPKWFERKFDLSFRVDLYPNVLARLRGAPTRLEELVLGIPSGVLTRKSGQSWSAQENAGHLLDVEPLWLARVDDYLAEVETLTTADLSNRKTHEANHNANPIEAILSGFRKMRLALVDRAGQLEPALYSRTALHPRLKIADAAGGPFVLCGGT